MLFIGMWANLLDREVISQLKQYSMAVSYTHLTLPTILLV